MEITRDNWEQRMRAAMELRDYRPRTIRAYVDSTRQFLACQRRAPSALTDSDVERYLLDLKTSGRLAPSSIHLVVHALRFFFRGTLRRRGEIFDFIRVRRPRTLPVVLSRNEVRTVLAAVQNPVYRLLLTTIYGLGLRLGEALRLGVADIDGERGVVSILDAKGATNRHVPLPHALFRALREHSERRLQDSPHLFANQRGGPIHETSIQGAFADACVRIGLCKRATPHTLRHCYATHLLEAGVSIRAIQQALGHRSLRTTEIYMHVTEYGYELIQAALEPMVQSLSTAEPPNLQLIENQPRPPRTRVPTTVSTVTLSPRRPHRPRFHPR
ncbi:MAG: tyrosine-type recombinase/integrase [Polyangiaceae bacterium]